MYCSRLAMYFVNERYCFKMHCLHPLQHQGDSKFNGAVIKPYQIFQELHKINVAK